MGTYEQSRLERASGIPAHPERSATVLSMASGAVLGLLIGIFAAAGLMGAIVGAILGAATGALGVVYVQRRAKRDEARDAALDREIGVSGGDLGARPEDLGPPRGVPRSRLPGDGDARAGAPPRP
jgi:hypothetical protein